MERCVKGVDLRDMISDMYGYPISNKNDNVSEHGYSYIQIHNTDEETVRSEILQEMDKRGLDMDLDAYVNILTSPDNIVMIRISY